MAVLACMAGCGCSRGLVVWRRGSWRWPFYCQPWPSSDVSRRGETWRRMPGNQDGFHEVLRATHAPDAAARQRLDQVRTMVPGVFAAAVGAILLARAVRQRAERRRETMRQAPARLGVWWQGTLLDLQGACCPGRIVPPTYQSGRTPCPRPCRGAA